MQQADRLHALDAVRAYALLLGVVLHAAAAFLEGFPLPLWNLSSSGTAALVTFVIHMFRMSAFFLIAGFFARMVVERRGIREFAKDRAKRILLPLLAGVPIVGVISAIAVTLGALPHGQEYLRALFEEYQAEQQQILAQSSLLDAFSLNHLWFLYYLLIFYVLTIAVRTAIRKFDGRRLILRAIDRTVAIVMGGTLGPFLVALPLIAFFSRLEAWNEWGGLPAPLSVVPQVDALVAYGIPFSLGWAVHRQIPLLLDLQNRWAFFLSLAFVLTAISLLLVGVQPEWEATLDGAYRTTYAIAYMAGVWCWVFAFVGVAQRFLSHVSPVTRYLADSSYWIYLMHLSVLAFFLVLIRPFDWHWSLKFLIMISGSIPILLFSYHYFVRFTWIGEILNGRRHLLTQRNRKIGDERESSV